MTPEVEIGGERVRLDPARAAFCVAHKTLLVSDLHLGKSAHYRVHGAPVADGDVAEQLGRLRTLVRRTRAERVVVVGDLLHSRAGNQGAWVEEAGHAMQSLGASVELVDGNHDVRGDAVLESWGVTRLGPTATLGGLTLVHDPDDAGGAAVCGHVHPVAVVRDGGSRLRLPMFWIRDAILVLPAFSLFTGGAPVRCGPEDRAFIVADDAVIEWFTPAV